MDRQAESLHAHATGPRGEDLGLFADLYEFTMLQAYFEGSLGQFSERFLEWLRNFGFTGEVHAVAEGTPVFANEPILEITAPLPQAQLRKQVFRVSEGERAIRDVITRDGDDLAGRPLLKPVMRGGKRLEAAAVDLESARRHARDEIARLPDRVRAIAPADPPYPVQVSTVLSEYQERVRKEVAS